MSEHFLQNVTEHAPARNVPAFEPFSTPRLLRNARELRHLEQLPWPTDVSGRPARIGDLIAAAAGSPRQIDDFHNVMCPCGCNREHKRNVSQALRRPRGPGFNVIYFWSEACKSKWNLEHRRRPIAHF